MKIVKIHSKNLFPKTTPYARVLVYPYPTDIYYVENSSSIYLPSVIADFYLNEFGYGEFQVIPNSKIRPHPNFYIVRMMYYAKYYYFVIYVREDHPDLVDIRDVIVATIPTRARDCPNNDCIDLSNIYV